LFTILFGRAYEQKGASLNLFAKDLVRTEVFGMRFPSSWLQSCTPAYGGVAAGLLISAGILALLTPRVKKLMGTVRSSAAH
jgi:dipeptide/tripeptide permease